MEELSLGKHLASNLEFWGQSLLGISRNLELMLGFGNVLPELPV